MAVDEAILQAVAAAAVPPTLRLYAWSKPCLSLGYAQSIADVDMSRLEKLGWHVVRRPTGGRAILHTDELTYSVALPLAHPLALGSVVDSYRRLSRALSAALELLGLKPQADKLAESRRAEARPVCFEVPSHYEITVRGHKLIGSAQVRRRRAILQHGTLPLHGDIARICEVLRFEDDRAREQAKAHVRRRAITLEAALGRRLSWDVVAEAVVAGFRQTFDIALYPDTLTAAERAQAEHYFRTTYNAAAWTQRR